jgi:hypothetical protein
MANIIEWPITQLERKIVGGAALVTAFWTETHS